jgi:hypothetical protein
VVSLFTFFIGSGRRHDEDKNVKSTWRSPHRASRSAAGARGGRFPGRRVNGPESQGDRDDRRVISV